VTSAALVNQVLKVSEVNPASLEVLVTSVNLVLLVYLVRLDLRELSVSQVLLDLRDHRDRLVNGDVMETLVHRVRLVHPDHRVLLEVLDHRVILVDKEIKDHLELLDSQVGYQCHSSARLSCSIQYF